ncbi:MAG: 3'-5' exonuclease [Nitrosomonas sp.]|uniref:3'-5' exonuclease n=1 Tax=Nitrosomonas sp. TaxID=42353 RepID=UPI0025D2D0D1|nr:3'-5' exonuclease [Nitrosomonas sp.]MBY0473653.1 3'-5' exonuclease [Nitrosomonas sp.]
MLDLVSNNIVVIDLETSGINPFQDEVLSVAIVPLTLPAPPCVVYVRPQHDEIHWSQFAKENFKKFAANWKEKAVPAVVALEKIEQYLNQTFGQGCVTAIGHNVGFDVAFIRKLVFLAGKNELPGISHRALDTHTMLYLLYLNGHLPASALSSDGAFEYFGIKISESNRHTALADALATRELVLKLLELLISTKR